MLKNNNSDQNYNVNYSYNLLLRGDSDFQLSRSLFDNITCEMLILIELYYTYPKVKDRLYYFSNNCGLLNLIDHFINEVNELNDSDLIHYIRSGELNNKIFIEYLDDYNVLVIDILLYIYIKECKLNKVKTIPEIGHF